MRNQLEQTRRNTCRIGRNRQTLLSQAWSGSRHEVLVAGVRRQRRPVSRGAAGRYRPGQHPVLLRRRLHPRGLRARLCDALPRGWTRLLPVARVSPWRCRLLRTGARARSPEPDHHRARGHVRRRLRGGLESDPQRWQRGRQLGRTQQGRAVVGAEQGRHGADQERGQRLARLRRETRLRKTVHRHHRSAIPGLQQHHA